MQEKSAARRWSSFAIGIFLAWLVTFVGAPALVECSPTMDKMARFVESEGLDAGVWYYTDVEAVTRANENTQNTVDYLPHGPGPVPEMHND